MPPLAANGPPAPVSDLSSLASQATAFLRAVFHLAVRPAILRGIPLYVGALLIGQLLLKAVPLHRMLGEVRPLLPAMALLWCLLASPVRQHLLGGRQTEYLRCLPIPNWVLTATLLAAFACIDAPWVLLCLGSGDLWVATVGPLLAAATHLALNSLRPLHLGAAATLLTVLTVAPPWVCPIPALLVAGAAAPVAWNRSHTGRTSGRSLDLPSVPWVGLTRALFLAVLGSAASQLRRSLMIQALMIGAAFLAVRNNDLTSLSSVLTVNLVMLGIGLPFVASRFTVAVVEQGWALGWLLEATGTPPWPRVLAGMLVMSGIGALAGGSHALAVGLLTAPAIIVQLVLLQAVAGAALASVALGLTAMSVQRGMVDPGRLGSGLTAMTIATPLLVGNSLLLSLGLLVPTLMAAVLLYRAKVTRPPGL